jgi:hypothetical protein
MPGHNQVGKTRGQACAERHREHCHCQNQPKRPGLCDEIKNKYWAALNDATDPADAERRLRELIAELERPYPSAAACLAEDLPALCIHLKYFPRLRKRFRSSNLLERSLEEVKRRTKVIDRFPGETSCLSMCWAVLDLFLAGARGLGLSDLEYKQVGPMKIARSHREYAVTKVAYMPLTAGATHHFYSNPDTRSAVIPPDPAVATLTVCPPEADKASLLAGQAERGPQYEDGSPVPVEMWARLEYRDLAGRWLATIVPLRVAYMFEEERVGLDQVTVLDQGERVEVIEAPRNSC